MANLNTRGITNSRFYYGIVSRVNEDNTADVVTYAQLKTYLAGYTYWVGDIVRQSSGISPLPVYRVARSHYATETTLEEHPEYFSEVNLSVVGMNFANPSRVSMHTLPSCKIFIHYDNTIEDSYKWLCVGTPVIVMNKLDEFIIVHFGELDPFLISSPQNSQPYLKNKIFIANYPDIECIKITFTDTNQYENQMLIEISQGKVNVIDNNFQNLRIHRPYHVYPHDKVMHNIAIYTPNGTIYDSNVSGVDLCKQINVDLNRMLFGRYIFVDVPEIYMNLSVAQIQTISEHPIVNIDTYTKNSTTRYIDNIVVDTIMFFLKDVDTNDLYIVEGIMYNNGEILFKYINLNISHPRAGLFWWQTDNYSVYSIAGIVPEKFYAYNFLGNISNKYNYTDNNCDSIDMFFGLLTLYPTINDGVLSITHTYNDNNGSWTGINELGWTANINIQDNGNSYPFLLRYDNEYNINGRYIKEFYDTDYDGSGLPHNQNSYRLFRFGGRSYYLNNDGTQPGQDYIIYTEARNHFPFSLRKCVYLNTNSASTNTITIDNLDIDTPTQGWLDENGWDIHQYERDGNTLHILDGDISSGTSTIIIYILYFLDYPIKSLYPYDPTQQFTIDKMPTYSINYIKNNEIFGILFFAEETYEWDYDAYQPTNILDKVAFFYDGTTIYNIEDEIDSKIASNYNNIGWLDYLNIGLTTNQIIYGD